MQALAFWKAVAMDKSNFLESLLGLLAEYHVRYCVIGGQGVNAYAEPLVSLDLDLVVAVDQLEEFERLLGSRFKVERPCESGGTGRFGLAPPARVGGGYLERQDLGLPGFGSSCERALEGVA